MVAKFTRMETSQVGSGITMHYKRPERYYIPAILFYNPPGSFLC